ncbi:unnamed protein product [Symbiodinium sp. CCMP2592]|nr:unnamed protein product [Symbiodinium sp. CCMP2592]
MRSLLDQGALEEVAALPERAREAASAVLRARIDAMERPLPDEEPAEAVATAFDFGRAVVSDTGLLQLGSSQEVGWHGLKTSRGKASPVIVVVAMAADLAADQVDSTMAANSALRDENEALASLMEEVHSLAEQWQEVCARAKSHGKETVAAELQELSLFWAAAFGIIFCLASPQTNPQSRADRDATSKGPHSQEG